MIGPINLDSIDHDPSRIMPLWELLSKRFAVELFCLSMAKKIIQSYADALEEEEKRNNEIHEEREREAARLSSERKQQELKHDELKRISRLPHFPYSGRFVWRQALLFDFMLNGASVLPEDCSLRA